MINLTEKELKLELKKEMICLNAANDSNDSAISYSSMSLSSSPVNSASIQALLDSPLIKTSSLNISSQNSDRTISETDSDITDAAEEEIIVAETPEVTPVNSQEMNPLLGTDMPLEVVSSQTIEDQLNGNNSETNSQNNCRNSLKRQTSVCVSNINTNITSSPRALAILKNAIKTSFNANKVNDKTNGNISTEEVNRNSNESINGVNSPPNSKLFKGSPLSRGSALLKRAKERIEKQEIERSPKISSNQIQLQSIESSFDQKLIGILRKHELQSLSTSGEPKAKKKKVLFAEPVVSSKLEFKSMPSPTFAGFEAIAGSELFQSKLNKEIEELNNKRNRNNFVHQNSTFDKEFDANCVDSLNSQQTDSPLLFNVYSDNINALPIDIPSCGQQHYPTKKLDTQLINEDSQDSLSNILEQKISSSEECEAQSSQSSEDSFQCSQVMPESSNRFDYSPEEFDSDVQTQQTEDDPIVMVPLRLSQIKELYHLFGDLIHKYQNS